MPPITLMSGLITAEYLFAVENQRSSHPCQVFPRLFLLANPEGSRQALVFVPSVTLAKLDSGNPYPATVIRV